MLKNYLVRRNVSLEHEQIYCLSEKSRLMKNNHTITMLHFRNLETLILVSVFPGIFFSAFKTVG